MFVRILLTFIVTCLGLCAAQCGPGMKKVTLDDDYFIINSSDIKFDGDTFKGQRKSNVSFYISGDPSNPKFRMLQMCFKYKCAKKAGYSTTAPPDEEECHTFNNETVCTKSKFLASGAATIPEDPCARTKFCAKNMPISIGVTFSFTYASQCSCKKVTGKKLSAKACIEK